MDLCNPLKTGNETFLYDNLKTILDKFNHIVLNMQLTGTYYTKYLLYRKSVLRKGIINCIMTRPHPPNTFDVCLILKQYIEITRKHQIIFIIFFNKY
jgi:hypothetical protein